MTKNRNIYFLTLLFFFISTVWAQGHVYVSGSMGPSFTQLGHSSPQISYFSGTTITDDYPLQSRHPESVVFGASGGYEFTGAHLKPAVALGLGIYGNLADYNFKGQVIETATGDPASTLYNYKFNITGMRVMAEIQLNWMVAQLSPFFNFGLGSAWNSLTGYRERAVTSNGYPPLLPFQSHHNNNFAFQIGAGAGSAFNFANVQSDFLHERIVVGYRYANLGATSFGTRGSAYPFRLNTGLLQTNELYLSYTHLF